MISNSKMRNKNNDHLITKLFASQPKQSDTPQNKGETMARHKAKGHRRDQTNLINFENARTERKQRQVQLIPRNTKQEEYLKYLEDPKNKIVISAGSAGTGKTLFAVTKAIQDLQNGKVDRIIITRPAVSVDEEHGFLPGTLEEKMMPWVRPIYDVFEEYYSKKDILHMMESGVIEVAPLAYMRGRTFKNSFIILDEAQLTTPNQMKMAMTRAGEGSRVVITGDIMQTDAGKTGLADVLTMFRVKQVKGIALVQFERCHVERSETVKIALELFGDE